MKQDILIIGNGGREHAFAWKLAQSQRVGKIYVAPGNAGTGEIARNISIHITDVEKLARFAEENRVSLTVVGPITPLPLGIVDVFRARGLRIFGPTYRASEIEFSKRIGKKVMGKANIPTASFRIFDKFNEAHTYIHKNGVPLVIKADGLTFGRGTYVCKTLLEAEDALNEIMLHRVYKDAGDAVIVEEFIEGEELSIHALCDGVSSILLPSMQDHKAILDGGKGRNTGGMGTIAPVPWVTNEILQSIDNKIIQPVLDLLKEQGNPFTGCLYPGIKITKDGPKVLEFNVRFGDTETQSYMRLLKTDLLDILEACVDRRLSDIKIDWHPGFTACIVLAAEGYPTRFKRGSVIYGIEEAKKIPGVVIFYARTIALNKELLTAGGRILNITAVGSSLKEALDRAYEAVQLITFRGMQYRRDIGVKALSIKSLNIL